MPVSFCARKRFDCDTEGMRSVDRNLPDPFEFSLAHQNPCGIEVFAQWRTENRSLRLCFVDLCMTVRNSSHQGPSFVPQNKVKIVIDDNSFDGKNLDAGSDYVGNIEPTLSRQRECYFNCLERSLKILFSSASGVISPTRRCSGFYYGGTPAAACACSSSLACDSTAR